MKAALEKCPAFADGCPFKQVRSMDELHELFAKTPHVHSKGTVGTAEKVLVAMLQDVHQQSEKLKTDLGECPTFSSACPFKEGVSNSLANELDRRSWSALAADAPAEQTEEPAAATKNPGTVVNDTTFTVTDSPTESRPAFSVEIKEGTKDSHKAAENVHFVKNFIRGKIDRELYKQLIADLWHVYDAMEEKLALYGRGGAESDPLVVGVHFPEQLNRTKELEKDMQFWFGDDWRNSPQALQPTPCTAEYVERLSSCSPAALVRW